jgi:hypothetical protein
VQPLEEALEMWFRQQRAMNIPISGTMLAEKARKFEDQLNILDFKASNGFIDRFKKRHGISFYQVAGEAADADANAAKDWKEKVLPTLLQRYAPEDVYNADESGLFYEGLPTKTLAYKGAKCSGGKLSKKRLTLLFCANMTGSDKRQLLCIGRSAKPRCFRHINTNRLPVKYSSNRKAWMTSDLWKEWIIKFDRQMVTAGRKILLIVDNVSSHKINLPLQAIEVAFLPPNTTSMIQPCDQGIIRSFKSQYRSTLLRRLLLWTEAKKTLEGFEISLLDAVHMASQAWSQVSQETITNCFQHAGFCQDAFSVDDPSLIYQPENTEAKNIFDVLASEFQWESSLQGYLQVDADVFRKRQGSK